MDTKFIDRYLKKQRQEDPFWYLYSDAMQALQDILYFQRLTIEAYKSHQDASLKIFSENYPKSKEDKALEKIVNSALKAHAKSTDYPPLIFKMSLVYAISIFDIYLNDFLTEWLIRDPRSLKTSKKNT